MSPGLLVLAGALTAGAPPRGLINTQVVDANWTTFIDLSRNSDVNLRYFTLVSSQPFLLSSRGSASADGAYDNQNLQLVARDGSSQIIIGDNAFAANAVVRNIDGRYYAFGGLYSSPVDEGFEQSLNQDGIHVLTANSIEEIRDGAWMSPQHGWERVPGVEGNGTDAWTVSYDHLAVDGEHEGREDAVRPSGAAQFDSKLSVVRMRGHWLLYARANLYVAGGHGGRYVMVARSRTENAWGRDAYEPFQLVDIEGYDRDGYALCRIPPHSSAFLRVAQRAAREPLTRMRAFFAPSLSTRAHLLRRRPGNIYLGAVSQHPFDDDMLIALYPVNHGQANTGNGIGESYIGLSMSCDGRHWSSITPLVWTGGLLGRTFDHPVDGLYMEDGHVRPPRTHTSGRGLRAHPDRNLRTSTHP